MIYLILIFFLLGCTGKTATPIPEKVEIPCGFLGQALYPQWFLSPPQESFVAFNTHKSARMDAYDRWCAFNMMRAKGFFFAADREWGPGSSFTTRDSIAFYYNPIEDIDTSSFIMLDSFSVGLSTAYLISLSDISFSNEKKQLCKVSPGLIAHRDGRIYGVGSSSLGLYNPLRGWIRAESRAIRELMEQTSFSLLSRRERSDRDGLHIAYYRFDLSIEDIRLERRWYDEKTETAFVAVSVALDQIKEWSEDDSSIAPIYESEIDELKREKPAESSRGEISREDLMDRLSPPPSGWEELNIGERQ